MTCNESEHDWVLQPKIWLLTFDCDLHKNPLHSGAEHTSICLVTMTWKVSELAVWPWLDQVTWNQKRLSILNSGNQCTKFNN